MNKEIVGKIFPEAIQNVEQGNCAFCGEKVGGFRNESSVREFEISGMCQECQDRAFGED